MSRYEVTVKKSGFGTYNCVVVDSENVKPVMQCEIENYNAGFASNTPRDCQWRIGQPVLRGDLIEYNFNDCCGFPTKKEAIECLKEDGLYWDGKDIHPLLVA